MSIYKTQAVHRLEAFFESKYQQMYGVAVREVGEHNAWDAVNNTYVSLIEKEERGRGQYNESYGSTYDSYVYGALYGTLKGMRKGSPEINESDFTSVNNEGEETNTYLATIGTYDNIDDVLNATIGPMEICSEFVAACDSCDANVEALVRAIRKPETLSPSFLSKFFAGLRKAAKSDCTLVTAIEDFIHIYGVRPQEVDRCLLQLGVCA